MYVEFCSKIHVAKVPDIYILLYISSELPFERAAASIINQLAPLG